MPQSLKPVQRCGATNNWNAALLAKRVSDVHIDTLLELSNYTIPVSDLASSEYWARCYDLLRFTLGYYGVEEVKPTAEETERDLESLLRLLALHRRFLITMLPKNNRIVKVGKAVGQSVSADCFVCICLNLACQLLIDPTLLDAETYDVSFVGASRLNMCVHGEAVPVARYSQQQLYTSWQLCADNWLSVDMHDTEAVLDLIDYRQALLYRTAQVMNAHFPLAAGEEGRDLFMLDMADRAAATGGTISSYVQWREIDEKSGRCGGVERSTRWVQEVLAFYSTTEMLLAIHFETVAPLTMAARPMRSYRSRLLLAFFGGEGAVTLEDASRFYDDSLVAFERFLSRERAAEIRDTTVARRLSKRVRKHMLSPAYKRVVLFGNGLMGHSGHNQLEKESLPKISRYHLTNNLHRIPMLDYVAGDLFPGTPGARDLALLAVFEQDILCANRNMKFGREAVLADYDLWRWLLPTPLTRAEEKHMGGCHESSLGNWEPARGTVFDPDDADTWCLPIRMRDKRMPAASMPCIVKLARNYYVYHHRVFYPCTGGGVVEAIFLWSLIVVSVCTNCEFRRGNPSRTDNVVDMGFLRPYLEDMVDAHVKRVPGPVRRVLDSRVPPEPGDVQDLDKDALLEHQRQAISRLFSRTRDL